MLLYDENYLNKFYTYLVSKSLKFSFFFFITIFIKAESEVINDKWSESIELKKRPKQTK